MRVRNLGAFRNKRRKKRGMCAHLADISPPGNADVSNTEGQEVSECTAATMPHAREGGGGGQTMRWRRGRRLRGHTNRQRASEAT